VGGESSVKVELEEFCFAFQDASIERRYYLELETGKVLHVSWHDTP